MRLRHSKYLKGQVLLETAIVFISLAVITIASTRLFSNLNLDMISRIDEYKQDRLNAVNGSPASPLDYLYKPPSDLNILPGGSGEGMFNPLFYSDPRIEQASLLLEEGYDFAWVALPYKINQAYYLADPARLYWVDEYYDEDKHIWVPEHWEPPEYIPTIKSLMGNSVTLANTSYNNYSLAIGLLQEALDNPIDEGPFDPEPEDQKQKEYNLENRASLEQTIEGLKTAQEGLSRLLNDELIPRLQDVQDYIGEPVVYIGLSPHEQAVNELAELVNFVGIIEPSILRDNGGDIVVTWIGQEYNLLDNHNLSNEDAVQAKELSTKIFSSKQVTEATLNGSSDESLENVAEALDEYLDLAITYWYKEDKQDTKKYYLDLSKIKSNTLYQITEVNRLLEEFKPQW